MNDLLKNQLKQWIDYRQKRFWAAVVFVIYTLTGFLILPMVMKNTMVDLVADRLGRTLQIEKIHVNPFNFRLIFEAIQLNDTDDVATLSVAVAVPFDAILWKACALIFGVGDVKE